MVMWFQRERDVKCFVLLCFGRRLIFSVRINKKTMLKTIHVIIFVLLVLYQVSYMSAIYMVIILQRA